MEFKNFKKDVEAAFNNMIAENLFVANVDKDHPLDGLSSVV